jgi:shikimate dehydrogenase
MLSKYAVIGHPIEHSKSPLIHHAFASQFGIKLDYQRVLSPLDGFEATVNNLISDGFKGSNVTVPFKFEAFALCDVLSEGAKAAKAVNTLTFKQDQILGDNTDGVGLLNDITRNLHVDLQGKKVLLMGAGGAACGVVLPLLKAGAHLIVVNRTAQKAIDLALTFNQNNDYNPIEAGSFDMIKHQSFDVIVNATSAGLADELPPISEANFTSRTLAYDMMYGRETLFMKSARAFQAQVADGLGMLVEQAAEAFWLWHGVRPNTASVIASFR